MSFRRWDNGKVIGYTKLVPDFRQNFKAPYYVVHRAHFHDALYKRALELGVDVRVASRVTGYNLDEPSVSVADGTTLSADLLVAADGAHPRLSHRYVILIFCRCQIFRKEVNFGWHR
jgi:salicylate hydroxylase